MEQILKLQANDIKQLDGLISNYFNDNTTYKQSRAKLSELQNTLESLFARIRKYDHKLNTFENRDKPYFRDNTFGKISTRYETARTDIEEYLNLMPEHAPEGDLSNILNGLLNNANDNCRGTTSSTNNNSVAVDQILLPYNELMDFIFSVNELSSNTSPGIAQTHLDMLNAVWKEFRAAIHAERLTKREHGINYSSVLQRYMAASSKLNNILLNLDINTSDSSNIQFSLPKLKLPEFHGNFSEWKAFISLFDRMVHKNTAVDVGLKIEYLKMCIKGDTAKLINHLDPTTENYDVCYNLLSNRYNNKRRLLATFIDMMLSLPNLTNESSEDLKIMHDTIKESIM